MAPPNAFGQYLVDHNLGVNDFPFRLRGVVHRLKANAEKVAPNSPLLALLADHLKVPLTELEPFAQAPLMEEKWIRKIQTQLDRNSIPRGNQVQHKKTRGPKKKKEETEDTEPAIKGNAKTPFAKLAASKGFTVQALADRIGVPHFYMWRVSSGDMAKNHPVLVPLAKVLGVEVPTLKRMMRRPVLTPANHARAQRDLLTHMEDRGRKREKSEPKALVPTPVTGVVRQIENGHPVPAETRTYNRLGSKRSSVQLREVARALVATINISVMKGETHTPPLPLADLYLVMQDYLQEKGIKANLLIDPSFGTSFDPK